MDGEHVRGAFKQADDHNGPSSDGCVEAIMMLAVMDVMARAALIARGAMRVGGLLAGGLQAYVEEPVEVRPPGQLVAVYASTGTPPESAGSEKLMMAA